MPLPGRWQKGAGRLRSDLRASAPQFSLLVGFWQLLFRRAEFQVLILGVDHAGKTVRAPLRAATPAAARLAPLPARRVYSSR